MSGAARPAAAEVPRALRVAIVAAEPAEASRLAALTARSGHQIAAADGPADVVLTDRSAAATPGLPTVALGAAGDDVAGVLPPEAGPVQLDAALRAVAAGLTVRPRLPPKRRFGPAAEEGAPVLTPREVEVLAALADGLSNKAAARRLGISPHTVKFHIEQLFHKLDAGCRAEAVAKGLKQQIVEL
ncbi:MAG TPA: response regulator transcription factor [Stellaceae bacterium]|jgi:DNA-binding NarL/FixJ family response regulator